MRQRAERVGTNGYVFGAPHFVHEPGARVWEKANCANALRRTLDGAGFEWATPHSLRRTVASLAHEAGAPLVDIADQLGHADPGMTARVYLGRNPFGDRGSVSEHL